MTTYKDLNQFARPPFTAECRARAWQHYQHLNSLSDFTARLQYWQDEVSKMGVVYDTAYSDFLLSPNPYNKDDEDQLNRWRLDWFRNSLIQSCERIVKYNWQGFWDDPDGTAFIIKSIDDLVSDFEGRLSTTLRKEDLIKLELQETCESIDSTAPTRTSGLKTDNLYCIDKLRSSLGTNKPLELALFEDTRFAAVGLYRLAMFWDIVHYEAYLKGRLAGLNKVKDKNKLTNDEPNTISHIWKGDVEGFWHIVENYAPSFIENKDGIIRWNKSHESISYLAGFIYVCQQKGWITPNRYSAPVLQNVLQETFDITFDCKPFKNSNLNGIDPKYRSPFKGIPYNLKNP